MLFAYQPMEDVEDTKSPKQSKNGSVNVPSIDIIQYKKSGDDIF